MATETLASVAGQQVILLDVSNDDMDNMESALKLCSSASDLTHVIDLILTVAGSRFGASSKFADLILSKAEKVSSVQGKGGLAGNFSEDVESILTEADAKVHSAALGSALAGFGLTWRKARGHPPPAPRLD